MNYRHSFHAGNFADLVKHAVVLALMQRLQAGSEPLTVIDTHAGAGLYDLTASDQLRSKEAEAGIARLMGADTPAAFEPLKAAVRRRNRGGVVEAYPGSPVLIAERLRPGDRYRGYELRAQVHGLLAQALAPFDGATGRCADGYAAAAEATPPQGQALVLIDPPYEQADDYVRAADCAAAVLARRPEATVAIWAPLKDLETFDSFLRRLEAATGAPALAAEARLRPLTDPMKMNGCAMVVLNDPGVEAEAEAICAFVAQALGGPGARAKVWGVGEAVA